MFRLRPALGLLAAFILFSHGASARDHITQCFSCHGDDGIAKEFDVPHLAGQQEAYLLNQMKAFKSGKRTHKEMKVMSREMSDREMREIAAFFAALPR